MRKVEFMMVLLGKTLEKAQSINSNVSLNYMARRFVYGNTKVYPKFFLHIINLFYYSRDNCV